MPIDGGDDRRPPTPTVDARTTVTEPESVALRPTDGEHRRQPFESDQSFDVQSRRF
ncbi:hypothetical protein [Halosimplex amylolyticum]|uniref:hypothetical protein n=1 Tax=Halosimplex amylolyticum TaxID=3396616 RepID=UPI003F555A6E